MQALGHYDYARAAYEAASRLEPQAAYAVNNLCYLAFVEGRLDTAIETCRKALEIDPTMTAARNNLALAFAATGRIDLARAEFVDAGDRASALYNSGIVYLAAGDSRSALDAFDEASKARPTFRLARERATPDPRTDVPGQSAGASERHGQRNRAAADRSSAVGKGRR